MTAQATEANPQPLPVFDGCTEHKVGTMEVNERWAMPAVAVETLLGMCCCCYGPLLLERFTDEGIGIGPGRCTKCQ